MSATIFKHEFRMHLRSVITWSVAVAAIVFVYMAIYPSFTQDAELLNEMMANFPPELLAAFGMTDIDMASVLGFYGLIFLLCRSAWPFRPRTMALAWFRWKRES